jgi:glutaredoxin
LQNNELDFTEINLDDGNEREKFTEKYPYLRTSPQIFCDGVNIGGFTDLIEEDPNDLR